MLRVATGDPRNDKYDVSLRAKRSNLILLASFIPNSGLVGEGDVRANRRFAPTGHLLESPVSLREAG